MRCFFLVATLLLLACCTIYPVKSTLAIDLDIPEQYAAVLAADQYNAPLQPDSPFFGLVFITVHPVVNSTTQFKVKVVLTHNVNFAESAGIHYAESRLSEHGVELMSLCPLCTGSALEGPSITEQIIPTEFVRYLRHGHTRVLVFSDNKNKGQIAAQIESRNDIFYAHLYDPEITDKSQPPSGAVLLRLYDLAPHFSGSGLDAVADFPGGVDFWMLSKTRQYYTHEGYNDPNTTVFSFGVLSAHVSGMNAAFRRDVQIFKRRYIETKWPVYGPGSSNMTMRAKFFDLDNLNHTDVFLGEFTRLPYFTFTNGIMFMYNFNSTSSQNVLFGSSSRGTALTPTLGLWVVTSILSWLVWA